MGDRLADLRAVDHLFTGLDHVHVVASGPLQQRELHLYFLTDPRRLEVPFDPAVPAAHPAVPLGPEDVVITPVDPDVPAVEVDRTYPPTWHLDPVVGRAHLRVRVRHPGGFGRFRLRLVDPEVAAGRAGRIDPFFGAVDLDFKVACADHLDCAGTQGDACTDEPDEPVELDYLARDFLSIHSALTTFLRGRHPRWDMPSLADPSAVLLDLLASVGDDLAFGQDAVAGESTLVDATQPRSRRARARLVDYEVHDGRSASTVLAITLAQGSGAVAVPAGAEVLARGSDVPVGDAARDGAPAAGFEVGRSLADRSAGALYVVHDRWNPGALRPWFFHDDDAATLPCGSTGMLLTGPVPDIHLWDDEGRHLLLECPAAPGAPPDRFVVTVKHVRGTDDLGAVPFLDPLTGTRYHGVEWAEPLPRQVDQRTLSVTANLVPATAGSTHHVVVRCGAEGSAGVPDPRWVVRTVERDGPWPDRPADTGDGAGRGVVHRVSLPGSSSRPLGWTGSDLRTTRPEIRVQEVPLGTPLPTEPDPALLTALAHGDWSYRPTLLEAGPEPVFTLEDGTWETVATHRGPHGTSVLADYAAASGMTLRFGTGDFGARPDTGQRFLVTYRLGGGTVGNVATDTLTEVPPSSTMPAAVIGVTNPLAVTDGVDAESAVDVRRYAPVAWRHDPLFAVRTEDYAQQAERLDWVGSAAAELRWTGSWPTVRVAADPVGAVTWTGAQNLALDRRLRAVKQAGRDVLAMTPRFVALDLELVLCVEQGFHPAHVAAAVRAALVGPVDGGPEPFFSPRHFTFGTPLDRSRLDAAVMAVPGVHAIDQVRLGARGMRLSSPWTARAFFPGVDGLLRLDADRTRPQHGSLTVRWEGSP